MAGQGFGGIGSAFSRRTASPWGSVIADRIAAGRLYHTIDERDDVQHVLDSAPTGAVIGIMPGRYYKPGSLLLRKALTLYGVTGNPKDAIFIKTAVDDTDYATFNVYDPDDPTGHIDGFGIFNLGFVNGKAGEVGSGSPPEPALGIGVYDGGGKNPGNATGWIHGCYCDGVHDGVQLFGNRDSRGEVLLTCNDIRSISDPFTVKMQGIIRSIGNLFKCDTRAPINPLYTDSPGLWKKTALHVNMAEYAAIDPTLDKIISVSDIFEVYSENAAYQKLGGTPAGQARCAGLLFYSNAGGSPLPLIRIVNPTIEVIYDIDGDPANNSPAGICHDTSNGSIASGDFLVSGGTIRVIQLNSGGSAPATVSGILNQADTANIVRVVGTDIQGSNAAGNMRSLMTAHANSTIEHHAFSPHATDNSGGGTISPLTAIP